MTTEAWRRKHWGPPCQDVSGRVTVGRAVGLKVDARAVPAFRALADTFAAHAYDVHPAWPDGDTGTYNCRHIGNDATRPWSAHAWGTAIDVNWQTNPDGSRLVTDMPDALVAAVQQIVTADGVPVWRWGGDWDRDPRTSHSYYDAMHFEVVATPAQLAAGIGTGMEPFEGDVVADRDDLDYVRRQLRRAATDHDETAYDPDRVGFREAVRRWQRDRAIGGEGAVTLMTVVTLQASADRHWTLRQ